MSAFVDNPLNTVADDEKKSPQRQSQAADAVQSDGAWDQRGIGDLLFWPQVEEQQEKEWVALREAGSASWIIHPECRFTGIWDVFSMILIVYSCVTIPYRLGFGLEAEGAEVVIDYAVDSIFMFDCMLTFRKAIMLDSKLIVAPGVLAKQYFKGWFVLDFFSSFPFNLVLALFFDLNNPDAARILKLIRVFRMVKILRMVRIKRLLKKFQDAMSIKNGVMISMKFALVTVMASHFIACLFFNQSKTVKEFNWALNYCVWADKDNVNDGCSLDVCRVKNCEMLCGYTARANGPVFALDNPGTNRGDGDDTQIKGDACLDECIDCSDMGQYTASIYYALVTMTTIGYGDILPANNDERIFCTVTMLVGASIFAYAITNMCTVVHNLNPSSVYNKGRMDELTDVCNFLGVEKLTKKRLMEFFFFKIDASQACHVNESSIILDMSESLRRQIRRFTLRKQLAAVPFLRKHTSQPDNPSSSRFLGAIATQIVSTPYAPGDAIIKQGEDSTAMYMLSKGDVSVIVDGQEITKIGDGCLINAKALFREGRNAYTVICIDNTDVYELTRQNFQQDAHWYGDADGENTAVRILEKAAIDSGLTVTDICDFTIDDEGTAYVDPLSAAQREAARQDEISQLKSRIQTQDEYIKLLAGSLAGME
eukprot:COSAG02_NODE_1489_length_12365_cov_22.798793_8_plen_652_part_00